LVTGRPGPVCWEKDKKIKKKNTHDERLEWQVIREALYNKYSTDGYPNFVPMKHTLRTNNIDNQSDATITVY